MYCILAVSLQVALLVSATWGHSTHFVKIITGVQHYYNCKYVSILTYNGYNDFYLGYLAAEVEKYSSAKYTRFAISIQVQEMFRYRHWNCRPMFVLLCDDKQDRSLFIDIGTKIKLSEAVWLLFMEKSMPLDDFFAGIDIPFDCEFLIAKEESKDFFVLTEVYRIDPTLPLKTYHFGNWTPLNELKFPTMGLYNRRNNLEGLALRTAVVMDSALLIPRKEMAGIRRSDFFSEVWVTLQMRMNFTSELVTSVANVHGVKVDSHSWNGLLGLVQQGKAEAICAELSLDLTRTEIVDFISVLQEDRQVVFIREPTTFKFMWTSFLLPFSSRIWVLLLLTGLLLAISLWSSFLVKNQCSTEAVCSLKSFPGALFYIYTSFCQQGQDVPNTSSGRVVCVVTYLTATVLLAGYSASLVSYLANRSPALPFTGFEELLYDGTYQVGVHRHSSTMELFNSSTDPVIRTLYNKFIVPNLDSLPNSNLLGLQQLCDKKKYAYIYSLLTLDRYADKVTCKIMPIPHAYIPRLKGMALARGSPYLEIFRHNILEMRRDGILRRLLDSTSFVLPEAESSFVIMDLVAVLPIFVILLIAIIGTILMLFSEILVKRREKQKYKMRLPY